MKKKTLYSKLIALLACMALSGVCLFAGCASKRESGLQKTAAVQPLPTQKGENVMATLRNHISVMNIGGAVGQVLTANELNWVQRILTDNPGLFGGFENPNDTTIEKCIWHGEFPGKLLTGIA